MSLTDLLKEPDVKERFRQEVKKPKMVADKDLLAPPLSQRYSLIGTAFDYLLRFYLQHLNPHAIRRSWIAEHGLQCLSERTFGEAAYDIDSRTLSFPSEDGSFDKAREIFNAAWIAHEQYLSSGRLTDQVLRCTIYLAQLDVVFRCGYVDEQLGVAYADDVKDLHNLIALVRPDVFLSDSVCLLNPTFGDASLMVGGADADLLIDGMLIDIKTTKHLSLDRGYFNQLIGYFLLHELAAIGEIRPKMEISKLAIYFSRHGHLEVFEVSELINKKTFPEFARWFSERAEQYRARRIK